MVRVLVGASEVAELAGPMMILTTMEVQAVEQVLGIPLILPQFWSPTAAEHFLLCLPLSEVEM
jgi:hypothetical protein